MELSTELNKSIIKIHFSSFWEGFDSDNNFITDLLKDKWNFIVTEKDPDFVFHSFFGNDYLKYNCIRIGFTGENKRPDLFFSDYFIGFDHIQNNDRYLRWPLFLIATPVNYLLQEKDVEKIGSEQRKFAAFVVSNQKAKERIDFFKRLSQYKEVSSGGSVLNNIGYRVEDINAFLRQHKFTIAFENESYPGYTTEKISQAMISGSIPIYWGNPRIVEDFNENSFVNIHRYRNIDEAIKFIIELDEDEQLYKEMLAQPWFKNNSVPANFQYERIENFLLSVLSRKDKRRRSNNLTDSIYRYKRTIDLKVKYLYHKISD